MILGFAGKAASGKTTAARHLAPLFDRETLIVPMAMVLRDEVETFLRASAAADYIPLVYGDHKGGQAKVSIVSSIGWFISFFCPTLNLISEHCF